jgi:ABC-type glycerol-3-phosphate transport system substrate-binding protein
LNTELLARRGPDIMELGRLIEITVPLAINRKMDGDYTTINNMYTAKTVIGMNSFGSQKELAKEFVQTLFSDQIQKIELRDGFPINKTALEEWMTLEIPGGTVTKGNFETRYANKVDKKILMDKICSLSTPIVNDTTLINMILDEAEKCLRGEITSEQAAKNVTYNTKSYLAE